MNYRTEAVDLTNIKVFDELIVRINFTTQELRVSRIIELSFGNCSFEYLIEYAEIEFDQILCHSQLPMTCPRGPGYKIRINNYLNVYETYAV